MTVQPKPAQPATEATPAPAALASSAGPASARHDQRWLASIVESSDDAIVSKSLTGAVVTWNGGAERLFGYSADEMIGQSIALLLPPDRLDEEARIVDHLLQNERIDHFETVRQRRDGQLVDVSLMISPLRDERGAVIGFSNIARDITASRRDRADLAKANQLLIASNQELEAFSYSVSHDLRAPLRSIGGFVSVLQEDAVARLNDEDRRLLGLIAASTAMMSRLIDDLLKFFQLNRSTPERAEVDMTELAREAFDEARSAAPQRAIEFHLAPLPTVSGDAFMLRQVFANLLSNAVKFTRPRTPAVIEVTGALAADEARFAVRDNGVGYDPKYADKLYGVFQRLHKARDFEGTGIGLSLVKRIVERHGGRVWSSSTLGEGSLFEFALPVTEADHV